MELFNKTECCRQNILEAMIRNQNNDSQTEQHDIIPFWNNNENIRSFYSCGGNLYGNISRRICHCKYEIIICYYKLNQRPYHEDRKKPKK